MNVKVNLKCKYNAQDEKVKSEKENFNDATTRKSKEKRMHVMTLISFNSYIIRYARTYN